jgi:hypothetical protein
MDGLTCTGQASVPKFPRPSGSLWTAPLPLSRPRGHGAGSLTEPGPQLFRSSAGRLRAPTSGSGGPLRRPAPAARSGGRGRSRRPATGVRSRRPASGGPLRRPAPAARSGYPRLAEMRSGARSPNIGVRWDAVTSKRRQIAGPPQEQEPPWGTAGGRDGIYSAPLRLSGRQQKPPRAPLGHKWCVTATLAARSRVTHHRDASGGSQDESVAPRAPRRNAVKEREG